jgi:hypothetical protein
VARRNVRSGAACCRPLCGIRNPGCWIARGVALGQRETVRGADSTPFLWVFPAGTFHGTFLLKETVQVRPLTR